MGMQVRQFDSYQQLPEAYAPLLAEARLQGLFTDAQWLELLMAHFYDKGHVMRVYTVEEAATGEPLMLLPARYTRADAAVPRALTIAAVGHMENYATIAMVFAPSAVADRRAILAALFQWLRQKKAPPLTPRADAIRLWPFEVGSPLGVDVREALRGVGFLVQPYTNSYNQYELTAGVSFEEYFSRRSSNQRYSSRRRRRNLEKLGELEFVMVTGTESREELRRAIDDYVLVAVRSWKAPNSTVSADILDFIWLAASKGCLRLGVLRLDGRAIAAQFWTFTAGVASAIRPNFDERFKRESPGVVLSNFCIEYLLDTDHADALDFGYGGDEYKEKWMKGSRYYCGFMAFNPATPLGLSYGLTHILGQSFKRALKWLLGKPRGLVKSGGRPSS